MLKRLFPVAGAAMILISGILAANSVGTTSAAGPVSVGLVTPTPTTYPEPTPTPKDDPQKPAPSPTMQP